MARPEGPKKYLRLKSLARARKKAGGSSKLAALIGVSYRMLRYYEVAHEAPPSIVAAIERIAEGTR
jgi:DNA-binding transcriptional regulator YdaS (Cro superfamily)